MGLTGCENGSTDMDEPVTKVITGRNISTEWAAIVAEVSAEKKYVILDLSGCHANDNSISGASSPSDNAFNIIQSNRYIKEIILPSTLTAIGDDAFFGCFGLTSVTIPSGVTSIGEWAFSFCDGLTGITIPNGVASIGDDAFYGCSGLTGITVDSGNTH
jgi:hypothetical protein